MTERTAADFFAGIGLVTLGLQNKGWRTVYAVDYSREKKRIYEHNFGSGHYHLRDVQDVHGYDVPPVTLAHASFPCTDLSVAGARNGISSGESSAFWHFARILGEMEAHPGLPPLVLLENVEGLLSSGQGRDLVAVLEALNNLGYSVDVLLLDAVHFVPQSRVRLFIIGCLDSFCLPQTVLRELGESSNARPPRVRAFIASHPTIRWHLRLLPDLPRSSKTLVDIIDPDAEWWERSRSDYLLSQMFDRHRAIVAQMMSRATYSYGTVFRRMRMREGQKRSTAELRTDGVAGCLRTPKGGSARQILVRAGYGLFDARLLNARENARLMGADNFNLPSELSLNDALFGFGDAVCVPVVEWLVENYLEPVLREDLCEPALPRTRTR